MAKPCSFSPLVALAALLVLATSAVAELVLISPNATSFVVSGGVMAITWKATGTNNPTLSVELVDESKQLFTGPLALLSNLQTTTGSANWTIPKLGFAGNNFSILLVENINGTAFIVAQGAKFQIKPEGTLPPISDESEKPSVAASPARGYVPMLVAVTMSSILLVTWVL